MQSLIVASRNYVDEFCTITVSSGDSYKSRIYDQKPSTRWTSVGSAEASTETILIEFKDRLGNSVSRTIDRFILLNVNVSRMYFEYWDGAAWQTVTESVFNAGTPNADENLYIEKATPVSTTKIRLTMTHTIGAVAEKLVGEIKACEYLLLLRHKVAIKRKDWEEGGNFRLQGGKLVSYYTASKFEAEVIVDQMTLASYEILNPLLVARSFMTWILWEDFRVADIYEVAARSKPEEIVDRKMELYTLSFQAGER